MLKIIKSGFYSSGRERLYGEISSLCDKGTRSILIVPEQQTVLAEGDATRFLPPSSATVFEVTNFTRLSNTTFRALGGLSGEYCDSSKKALIMWRALTELSPFLTATMGRRDINTGLVESSLAAVAEMQSHGIHPSELAESSENEQIKKDKRLSDKLSDLSKFYSLYKNILCEKYADVGDDAEAMLKKLTENPKFLSDTHIYIEGFTSFTEPQYKLLGLLASRTEVTVLLTASSVRERAFEFTEINECEERLSRTARREGAVVKLFKEEGYRRKYKNSLYEICDLLWSNIPPKDNISLQSTEDLRIFEAKTPFEECEFICADIKRRVMAGASYSDFAILCRGLQKYVGILDGALKRAALPAFTSFRRDIEEFEAVKLIFSAYAAIRSFSREEVITYAKCPLSGVSREECDEFEMYVNKWQINGTRFTDGEFWNMSPAGYETGPVTDFSEKLLRIDGIRGKITQPLMKLSEDSSEAKSAKDHAKVLLEFITEIEMEKNLEIRHDLLKSLGEDELAQANLSLWQVIVYALDTVYEVLGDTPCDCDGFVSQLKAVFSTADIGAIPAVKDEITVGSADMLRLYEKPHVYMIGVNEGEFPATVNDNSYFSEHDKSVLSSLGLSIEPDLEIKGARELYIFSRAFSYASESVTLSYSACNARFKATAKAEVLNKIIALTGKQVEVVKISSLDLYDRLYSPDDAICSLDSLGINYASVRAALCEGGFENKITVSEGSISNAGHKLSQDALQRLYNDSLSLTQSRIDKYVSCPFGHFCKFTLGLKDDERAEFDSSSVGSFIHAILENFFRALSKDGKSAGELTREERVELTRQSATQYVEKLKDGLKHSAMTKIKTERLCRAALPVVEGLCEEFAESLFEPKFFELSISRDKEDAPSPVSFSSDKGDVTIYGVIDRVDAYKHDDDVYIRVVDYKTGHKVFSPTDMAEGANLQMFLYLKSLIDSDKEEFRKLVGATNGGRLIPAGVIYVKTAVSDARVDVPDDGAAEDAVKAMQEREGMILDDPTVIDAMKLKHTPLYSAKSPDKILDSKRKFLYSETEFDTIMDTVKRSVTDVADRMREGRIEAIPKSAGKSSKIPCEYCEFKPICRSAAKK